MLQLGGAQVGLFDHFGLPRVHGIGVARQAVAVDGGGAERLDRAGHGADLVPAGGAGDGVVGLALGQAPHHRGQRLDGLADAARQRDGAGDQRQKQQPRPQPAAPHLGHEVGGDVVHVKTRADRPAPGREQRGIGQLGQRIAPRQARDEILGKAAPLARGHDHLADVQLAVGIGGLPRIRALAFGIGVHDPQTLWVVDEDIVVVAIADGAGGLLGAVLGLVQGHRAGLGLGCEMGQHADRAFDLGRDQLLAVLPQKVVQRGQLQRHRKDAERDGNPGQQGQFT